MPPAGRPRSGANRDLPPGLLRRTRDGRTLYYYQHPNGYQEPLGANLKAAIDKWSEYQGKPHVPNGFSAVADAFEKGYFREIAIKTQREYRLGLARLKKVFNDAELAAILPVHVGKLMEQLQDTPVQANRLKALLSTMWNWGRSRGYTSAPNPCAGIYGYSEKRRGIIITPSMFAAVYEEADQILRDWMELDLLIGQRVTDVLKVRRTDVISTSDKRKLALKATKTDAAGEMDITGDLERLMEDLHQRPRKATGPYLIQTDEGQRVTYAMLRNRFDAAREAAKEKAEKAGEKWLDWQMRDMRKTSLNQAATLEEARRRGLHKDPRTTARHYEITIGSTPGSSAGYVKKKA